MGDHYETLRVARGASPEVVAAAYRALVKIYHPDGGTSPDGERMRAINVAREVLSDPTLRATYDADLAEQADSSGGPPEEPLGDEGWGEDVEEAPVSSPKAEPRSADPAEETLPDKATLLRRMARAATGKLLERVIKRMTIGVVAAALATWLVASIPGWWSGFVGLLPWTEPAREIATLSGHDDAVSSLAFSPDGEILATASHDGTVRLWDTQTHEHVATLDHDDAVGSLAFSPDGEILATASGLEVSLWDPATRERVATLPHDDFLEGIDEGRVLAAAFSPDGEILATSSGAVLMWDIETRERLPTPPPPWLYSTTPLEFSPDGTLLTAARVDTSVPLWDTETYDELAAVDHDAGVLAVTFSPDGALLATAGLSEQVRVWDVENREQVTVLEHGSSLAPRVSALAFSPDGASLASAGEDHVVRVWDLDTHEQTTKLSAREDVGLGSYAHNQVHALAFSPDGTLLASGDGGGRVVLWDSDRG